VDSTKEMTGYEKAAVLLLYLGEEATSHVFSKLRRDEVKKISGIMAGKNFIPAAVKDSVLDEFLKKTDATGISSDGDALLKSALHSAFGKEKGDALLKELDSDSDVLSDITGLPPQTLAHFLRNEHPQTIAMILAHLDPGRGAEVLGYYPMELKKDVLMRIATLENVSPEVVEEVGKVLREQLLSVGTSKSEKIGGAKPAAEILNRMDKSSEEMILEKIEMEDADLSSSLRDLMFVFEDINTIDDRGIQTILKEVNNEQLTLALKTASEELKEKILRNLSDRAAEMLKDDMEAMGPVKLSEVESVQQAIVNITRKLEEQGKIIVGGKGGEDLV